MLLKFRRALLPALLLVACTSLHADVTMRMVWDFKINVALPTPMPQLPFNEILTRIKGDHGYAAIGPIVAITDLATGKVTLLDPKAQQYATVAMADYLSKVAGASGQHTQDIPDQAKQILATMKFDAESRDTGRTDRIHGIDAYEREVVVNISIPVPIPGQANGLHLSLKIQIWKPKASEFERVPALHELAAYNERNKGFGDPSTVLRQVFGSMPGMGDHLSKMVDELTKGGNVSLGMHMGIFVPGLAKILEQMGAKGLPALPPDDQPLVDVNFNLKELSSDKVPDEVFAIPAGYKEVPMEGVLKGMTAAFTGGKPAEKPSAEPAPSKSPAPQQK
ncbi:MAG: hypothetical protein ABSH42_05410 [Bryobacteraceae bacterium]|jgi:hypothetical protein